MLGIPQNCNMHWSPVSPMVMALEGGEGGELDIAGEGWVKQNSQERGVLKDCFLFQVGS